MTLYEVWRHCFERSTDTPSRVDPPTPEEAWNAAVEACVKEVEAAGCSIVSCTFRATDKSTVEAAAHGPICPIALAAKLRGLAA